jgi:5-methylcytosine-specific restriction enzyme A
MPAALTISRPCARSGCAGLAAPGSTWGPAHQPPAKAARLAVRARSDARRGSAHSRGYDARWQKARLVFLACHAYRCAGYGLPPHLARCRTVASVVDHIIPHRGDPDLFWDETNWQCLCKSCHDRKTATEDRPREKPPEE